MTCIVGVVHKKGVLLAGDAQSSGDNMHRYDTGAKTFQLSPVLAVAYCGSGRLGQILQYHLADSLENPPLGMDERYWCVREFVPYVRNVLDAHGHLTVVRESQVEELGNSAFLLACRNRLFLVEPDFSINEHVLPYEADGSGRDAAIGSLHADLGLADHPVSSIERALRAATKAIEAAAEFTNYVGGPISSVATETYTAEEKTLARKMLA